MKAAGIIVEYNPFHNGHRYHLHQTISQTKADCIVAVMSGHFLQRGEPALLSKWARTKMALAAGVDIVVELPYHVATQNAEHFANGAVSILHALNCHEICFGSEHGKIDDFIETFLFLKKHEKQYQQLLKQYLKQGISYPKAASLAYSYLNRNETLVDLTKPNNILGFYYVKSIEELKCDIKAQTIKRSGADYHDEAFTSEKIASATSIRKTLFSDRVDLTKIQNYIPKSTAVFLEDYYSKYKTFHNWELYFSFLKYKLGTLSTSQLQEICEVEEGIENRLQNFIIEATSFQDFMNLVKTKRYTWTRIQRMCLHILTHTYKEEMRQKLPSYIRLLGMSEKGQKYLRFMKKKLGLPLISKVSSFEDPLLKLDLKATYAYGSVLPEPIRSTFIKKDYSTPPIRL